MSAKEQKNTYSDNPNFNIHKFKAGLKKLLQESYDDTGWVFLLQELGEDPDDIIKGGSTNKGKASDIVEYFDEKDELDKLLEKVKSDRPKKSWPTLPQLSTQPVETPKDDQPPTKTAKKFSTINLMIGGCVLILAVAAVIWLLFKRTDGTASLTVTPVSATEVFVQTTTKAFYLLMDGLPIGKASIVAAYVDGESIESIKIDSNEDGFFPLTLLPTITEIHIRVSQNNKVLYDGDIEISDGKSIYRLHVTPYPTATFTRNTPNPTRTPSRIPTKTPTMTVTFTKTPSATRTASPTSTYSPTHSPSPTIPPASIPTNTPPPITETSEPTSTNAPMPTLPPVETPTLPPP